MKRFYLFVAAALFAVVFPAAASAATVPAAPHVRARVAPADEYFGRMKMSVLEITNQIRDASARMNFNPELAATHYNKLALTEEALEDWARKYPNDSWIAPRAYDLSHLFWRMHTTLADQQAARCRSILFARFPSSRYALTARGETAAAVAPAAQSATAANPAADVGK